MMNRILLLMLLIAALPIATFANTLDFNNSGGTLSGNSSGLTLSGTLLIHAGTLIGGDLGSITLSTGALTSGSLTTGGTFAAGGSFVITGNGSAGIFNGAIFTGTFSTPATWTLLTLANGTHNYTLSGTLSGTWDNGETVSGETVQLTINVGKGFFDGSTTISGGGTTISGLGLRVATTPEPGSLIFFGTGLVGMASVLRRRKT